MKREEIVEIIGVLKKKYLELIHEEMTVDASNIRHEIDAWENKLRNFESNHNLEK